MNPVRTSQEAHYISATEPSRLLRSIGLSVPHKKHITSPLQSQAVAAYCENHKEYTDTLCGQNAGL
jgi:hypothetical protein